MVQMACFGPPSDVVNVKSEIKYIGQSTFVGTTPAGVDRARRSLSATDVTLCESKIDAVRS